MNHETWQFINTFAPWLSALGTISAVIVSLYLATKGRRIDLKVNAALNTLVQQGMPSREYVTISVVNLGHRAATVTSIGWVIGFVRKRHFFQVPGAQLYSSTIPLKLNDGETANYFISVIPEEGFDWVTTFRSHLGKFPKLTVYSMKVQVFTSVGKRFQASTDVGIRNLLTKTETHQTLQGAADRRP